MNFVGNIHLRYIASLCPAIPIFFLAVIWAFPQSVAEVAKKSKEENKKKATVRITNDILKPVRPDSVSSQQIKSRGDFGQMDLKSQGYYVKFYKRYGELELYRVELLKAQIDQPRSRIKWLQGEIDKRERQLEDLSDEARREGVPAGIARQAKRDVIKYLKEEERLEPYRP